MLLLAASCGSGGAGPALDAGHGADRSPADVSPDDVSPDDAEMCAPGDGGAVEGSSFVDTACGCARGNVCVREIGGVAGDTGNPRCVPIPPQCRDVPSCACMAACACASGLSTHPELCSDQSGSIDCDNGIR